MQKFDFSIHFTLKEHSIEDIDRMFEWWVTEQLKQKGNNGLPLFVASESGYRFDLSKNIPRTVVHHCFLQKNELFNRGLSNQVYDFIETVSGHSICWDNPSQNIGFNRKSMLTNLKRLNGVALFIGNIEGDVEEELKMAQELGIEIIQIGELVVK